METIKIELSKEAKKKESGKITSFGEPENITQVTMGVDADFIAEYAVDIFTAMYKNPAEAMVREMISNARDAVVVANRISYDPSRKVYIDLKEENHNGAWADSKTTLVIKDQGTGMSHDEITQVYSQYKKTAKSSDMEQIGGFGFGSKSPLACVNSFVVRSVKDGLLSVATLNNNGKDKLCIITDPVPTDEENGTTVTIPVPQNLVCEVKRAIEKISEASIDDLLVVSGEQVPNSFDEKAFARNNKVFIGESSPIESNGKIYDGIKVYMDEDDLLISSKRNNLTKHFIFNVGGYPYEEENDASYGYVVQIYVVTPIGLLDFPRARDHFIVNERYQNVRAIAESILNKNIQNAAETVLRNQFQNNFSEAYMVAKYQWPGYTSFETEEKKQDEKLIEQSLVEGSTKITFRMNGINHSFTIDFAEIFPLQIAQLFVKMVYNDGKNQDIFVAHLPVEKTPASIINGSENQDKLLSRVKAIFVGDDVRKAILDVRYGWRNYSKNDDKANLGIFNPPQYVIDYLVENTGAKVYDTREIREEEKIRRSKASAKNRVKQTVKEKTSLQAIKYDIKTGEKTEEELIANKDYSRCAFMIITAQNEGKPIFYRMFNSHFMTDFINIIRSVNIKEERNIESLYLVATYSKGYNSRRLDNLGIKDSAYILYDGRKNGYPADFVGSPIRMDIRSALFEAFSTSNNTLKKSLLGGIKQALQDKNLCEFEFVEPDKESLLGKILNTDTENLPYQNLKEVFNIWVNYSEQEYFKDWRQDQMKEMLIEWNDDKNITDEDRKHIDGTLAIMEKQLIHNINHHLEEAISNYTSEF